MSNKNRVDGRIPKENVKLVTISLRPTMVRVLKELSDATGLCKSRLIEELLAIELHDMGRFLALVKLVKAEAEK